MSTGDELPFSPEEARTLFLALIAALGDIHGAVKGINDVAVSLDRIADEMRDRNKLERIKSGYAPR